MESKATELNTGIRNTIEQLANETDALTKMLTIAKLAAWLKSIARNIQMWS